jgi:hypothetical protein
LAGLATGAAGQGCTDGRRSGLSLFNGLDSEMQKAYAEGLRALYMYASAHQDAVCAGLVSGVAPDLAARIHDLLLPVVKGAGSERSYAFLAESLPVLGQVSRDGGETLGHLLSHIEQFCDRGSSHDQLAAGHARLTQALADVRGMLSALLGYPSASRDEPTEVYRVGLRAVPFLLSVGDLLIGWLLLWHAEVALDALKSGASQRDGAFYRGKVASAMFFAETVLPRLAADRVVVEAQSLEAMELDEEAF